jgi:hypothetical protein
MLAEPWKQVNEGLARESDRGQIVGFEAEKWPET